MTLGIAKKLRMMREERRLKQREMAAAAGVGVRYYQALEQDVKLPSVEMLEKMLTRLGVSPEQFFGVEKPKISPSDLVPLLDAVFSLGGITHYRRAVALAFLTGDASYWTNLPEPLRRAAQALSKAL